MLGDTVTLSLSIPRTLLCAIYSQISLKSRSEMLLGRNSNNTPLLAAYRPPPTSPQFSFAPCESSDVHSASSAGELTGGTLSVDSESSRFFPFLSDLEFHTKPRTCANGNCRTH